MSSSAAAWSRAARAGTTRRSTPIRHGDARRPFRPVRPQLVLGRQRHRRPQQGQADDASATSTPPTSQLALGPVAACLAATGCVPFNIFGGAGSITQKCSTMSASSRTTAASRSCGASPPTCRAACSSLPGGPLGLAVGVEHRDQKGRFDPDPIVAAGLGSDIPAQPSSGGYNVDEAYAEINAPCSPTGRSPTCSSSAARSRFSDYSSVRLDRRPSRRGSTGSRSGTCASAAHIGRLPRADHRRIVRHAVALRPGTCRSVLGGPEPDRRNSRQLRRPRRAAGVSVRTIRRSPCLTSGNENLKPETSKGWNRRRGVQPKLRAALLDRGELLQHQDQGRDFQRSMPASSWQRCVVNTRSDRLRGW